MAEPTLDPNDIPQSGNVAGDDGEANGAAPKDAQGKKSSKKLLLIIGAPLLLVLLGAAGAFFAGMFDKPAEDKAASPALEAPDEEAYAATSGPATYYALPEMIVNLQAERSRPVFLKIVLSLELEKPTDVPIVETQLPRLVDSFQIYLRELRVDELRGSSGIYRLREELLTRVRQIVAPVKVRDVLFKEMLVQ